MLGLTRVAFALLSAWIIRRILKIGTRDNRYPPGPPTLPIIGNLASVPICSTHRKLTEWAREYGPIYSLKFGPQTVIVLTGPQTIYELIDKKSGSTADRPSMHVVDVITEGNNLAVAHYGPVWRLLRKTAHTILTPDGVQKHLPIQTAEATQLLHDLIQEPDEFWKYIRRYANSVIMSILFGKRSPRYETSHIAEFFYEAELFNEILSPGAQPPVDLLPILKYTPERWARWKRLCREIRTRQRKLYFGLVDECDERIKHGKENGSFMEDVLKNMTSLGLSREQVGYLGAILIEGGSDTTGSLLQHLPKLLAMFPTVQVKAQEEIDSVIGDRLPTIDDIDSLPYIRCLIQELQRFCPPFPLGVPHASMEHEECCGFLIPQGSTIILNLWGLFHDPDLFHQPDRFWPERFLLSEYGTKQGVDTTHFRSTFVFGGGRRICPGQHLANHSLALVTTSLIWAFNFRPHIKEDGSMDPLDVWDNNEGIIHGPKPYKCSIAPRSSYRKELIEKSFVDATDTYRLFEHGLEEEEKEILRRARGYRS